MSVARGSDALKMTVCMLDAISHACIDVSPKAGVQIGMMCHMTQCVLSDTKTPRQLSGYPILHLPLCDLRSIAQNSYHFRHRRGGGGGVCAGDNAPQPEPCRCHRIRAPGKISSPEGSGLRSSLPSPPPPPPPPRSFYPFMKLGKRLRP